jgi:hypothetical protein
MTMQVPRSVLSLALSLSLLLPADARAGTVGWVCGGSSSVGCTWNSIEDALLDAQVVHSHTFCDIFARATVPYTLGSTVDIDGGTFAVRAGNATCDDTRADHLHRRPQRG